MISWKPIVSGGFKSPIWVIVVVVVAILVLLVNFRVLSNQVERCQDKLDWNDICGITTSVHEADAQLVQQGELGYLFVKGVKKRASVIVTDKALIYKREGDSLEPVTFESLGKWQIVRVTFTGELLESHPPIATAREVVILYDI